MSPKLMVLTLVGSGGRHTAAAAAAAAIALRRSSIPKMERC